MFTGIVLESAKLVSKTEINSGLRFGLEISSSRLKGLDLGSSVALDGVCLTLIEEKILKEKANQTVLFFDLSPETLQSTNLANKNVGDRVHVEAALRVGESLGGHWVSGHVEALAKLKARKNHGDFEEFTFEVSDPIRKKVAPYLIPKGSIAVDGVSLTINELRDEQHFTEWTHMLIPHTLERTHFVSLKVGELVNIECDLMAKYLERFRLFLKLN